MSELRTEIIGQLREMARQGDSVGAMFGLLKKRLGSDGSIVTVIEYLRSAFCLSLAEVKPVAALSRTEGRHVLDESLLDELVMPQIKKHRREWDG